MVRTVATAVRASGGKSSKAARGSNVSSNSYGASFGSDKHSTGGNPVCPRETPTWQKPITNFFTKQNNIEPCADKSTKHILIETEKNESSGEGSSRMCNIVESEDFEDRTKDISIEKTTDEKDSKLENIAQNQSDDNVDKENSKLYVAEKKSYERDEIKNDIKHSVNSEICDKESNGTSNGKEVKEVDKFSNENKETVMNKNKKSSIRDDDDDIISAKRQKLDFYKHLEEIEKNAS